MRRKDTACLEEMAEEVGGPSHLLSGPDVQVRQIPLSTHSSVMFITSVDASFSLSLPFPSHLTPPSSSSFSTPAPSIC